MRTIIRLVAAVVTCILMALSGPALASGCHHHHHHYKHVTVSATFTDQQCVVTETSAIYTPGSYDAPDFEGTYKTITGDTEPGDTITITYHAKRGYVIDGQKIFTWTYMPHPTAEECVPPPPVIKHAVLKIRKFPSCNKSGRFVEIVERSGWKHLKKTHGPHRQRWVIRGTTKDGFTFHRKTHIKKVIHLKHLKNCGTHSS